MLFHNSEKNPLYYALEIDHYTHKNFWLWVSMCPSGYSSMLSLQWRAGLRSEFALPAEVAWLWGLQLTQ